MSFTDLFMPSARFGNIGQPPDPNQDDESLRKRFLVSPIKQAVQRLAGTMPAVPMNPVGAPGDVSAKPTLLQPGETARETPPTLGPGGMPPVPMTPIGPAQQRLEQLNTQGPPQLHGWKKVLDIAATALAPTVEAAVPGTPGNYQHRLASGIQAANAESEIGERNAVIQKDMHPPQKLGRAVIDDPNNPGNPLSVDFDPAKGGYLNPDTGQPIPNAKPWTKPAPTKEPLHVSPGEMVLQADGSWKQVGTKEATSHYEQAQIVDPKFPSGRTVNYDPSKGKYFEMDTGAEIPHAQKFEKPDKSAAAVPTVEDAKGAAQDIYEHRMAPSQLSQLYGGFGTAAQQFKRMVMSELHKLDPNYDLEQAEGDYVFAKSPGFQNTVRYMTSVQDSIPMVIDRAQTLANGNVRSLNALLNAGKNQFNNIDLKKFQTDRLLVADEIAKILQGGGSGSGTTDAKLEQAGSILRDSDSPAAIAATLGDVNQLIGYRRKALVHGTYVERNATGATAKSAPAAAATVNMKAPNGQIKPVPADQVEHYKSLGAVPVDQAPGGGL